MKPIKTALLVSLFSLSIGMSSTSYADQYVIDTKDMHAAIEFKISHLGISFLKGQFRQFSGNFYYDPAKPQENKVYVKIDVTSLDTNHAERNKHLKSDDFFDTKKYPTAEFVSTSYTPIDDTKGVMHGNFTLRGISKPVDIQVTHIGGGKDPWGGFRQGFEGSTTLHLSDFNMKGAAMLGPVSEEVQVMLYIEGIKQ
jgi:polyisoprenoid-binding protein YceI